MFGIHLAETGAGKYRSVSYCASRREATILKDKTCCL
jgi:hypothetical protein